MYENIPKRRWVQRYKENKKTPLARRQTITPRKYSKSSYHTSASWWTMCICKLASLGVCATFEPPRMENEWSMPQVRQVCPGMLGEPHPGKWRLVAEKRNHHPTAHQAQFWDAHSPAHLFIPSNPPSFPTSLTALKILSMSPPSPQRALFWLTIVRIL